MANVLIGWLATFLDIAVSFVRMVMSLCSERIARCFVPEIIYADTLIVLRKRILRIRRKIGVQQGRGFSGRKADEMENGKLRMENDAGGGGWNDVENTESGKGKMR